MAAVAAPRRSGSGRQPREIEALRDDREELAARRQEVPPLVAALRFVARAIEALAFDTDGDVRQADNAARLRGIADQVERRWESVS